MMLRADTFRRMRMTDRNYYMVRAMSSSWDDFKIFFDYSVVAVGWSEVDFTEYPDSEDLRKAIVENIIQTAVWLRRLFQRN